MALEPEQELPGMHVEFTGRQCTATPKLKAQAMAYLERIVPITHGTTRAHFIFTEDKYRRIVEVELYCRSGNLFAKCEGTDMEQALHDALRRIEQQVVRVKDRDQTIRNHAKQVIDPATAGAVATDGLLSAPN